MKKLILAVMFMVAWSSGSARAQWLDPANWSGKVGIYGSMPTYTRDYYNGQDLAGVKTVLFKVFHHEHEALHLGFLNAWNARDGQFAVFGVTMGTPTGTLGETIKPVVQAALPDLAPKLQWVQNLANYISFDVSVGYRFLGHTEDVSPLILGIGAGVKIPFQL